MVEITDIHSLYCVPAVPEEKKRLERQYLLKKAAFGMSSAVPSYLTDDRLAKMSNVLDVGAGTCAWILDFARMPQIKARLRTSTSDTQSPDSKINLYACDVDAAFFPDRSITETLGITTFQQDLTKPFPSELYNKFDLIHASLLVICLTASGWESALNNCWKLLRPGGLLFIDELSSPIVWTPQAYLGKSSTGMDAEEYMKGDTWLAKANCIFIGQLLHRGFVTDLTFRLPEMLQAAGLVLKFSQWGFLPIGKTCRTLKGLGGDDLAEFEDFSMDNLFLIWLHQCKDLMEENALEAPRGVKITDEEELERLLNDLREGVREEGCVMPNRHFIAQK